MNTIVVFDLETTGLNRDKDQIIQFAGIKIDTDTNAVIDSLNQYIQPVGDYSISVAAYFKHHINAEFLKDKPHMHEVAHKIIDFIGDSAIMTYNGTSFDIPFLLSEIRKCGYDIDFINRDCYDVFLEEKRRNGNSLGETYKRYSGKTMEEAGLTAHDALSDVKATFSIFYAQNKTQKVEPEQMFGEDNVIKIMDFQGVDQPCFALGKYRAVGVEFIAKIDQGYIKWAVSDKSSFMQSTKDYLKQFINE